MYNTCVISRSRMQDADRDEVARFIARHWGSTKIMSCGKTYYPNELEGLIERRDGQIVGLLTMITEGDSLEILTLNSTLEGHRLGSSLTLDAIEDARGRGIRRVWLTTTNDNVRAITLYQRLGFRIVEVHVDAVDEARLIKPEIPEIGQDGIPIHDEIVLELKLQPYSQSAGADATGS